MFWGNTVFTELFPTDLSTDSVDNPAAAKWPSDPGREL